MLLEPDGHLFINGCFNWMMSQIFRKEMVGNHHFHPFKTGCLGYQAEQHFNPTFVRPKDASLSRRGDHAAVAEDWYIRTYGKNTIYSKRSVSFCAVFLFWLSLPW